MKLCWAHGGQVLLHSTPDDRALELKESAHLDGAAEGDFAITLREVHVSHAEIGALNEDGEVDPATPAQVLDVAISSVLPARNGSTCLRCDSFPVLAPFLDLAQESPLGLGKKGKGARVQVLSQSKSVFTVINECLLTFVPDVEQLFRWGSANETRVNEAGKTHTWDVTRRRPDTLEVPDSLASIWEVVSEESSTVLTIENSSEAPFITRKRAEVKNLDNEQISWHRRFAFGVVHANWPTQVMNQGEVDVLHILGAVIVEDLPAGPVDGLHSEDLAFFYLAHGGDIRVPSVVEGDGLLPWPLVGVHGHNCPWSLDRRHS